VDRGRKEVEEWKKENKVMLYKRLGVQEIVGKKTSRSIC